MGRQGQSFPHSHRGMLLISSVRCQVDPAEQRAGGHFHHFNLILKPPSSGFAPDFGMQAEKVLQIMNTPNEELSGVWKRYIENTLSVKTLIEASSKASFGQRGFLLTAKLHSCSQSLLGGEYQTDVRLRTVHRGIRKALSHRREACSPPPNRKKQRGRSTVTTSNSPPLISRILRV